MLCDLLSSTLKKDMEEELICACERGEQLQAQNLCKVVDIQHVRDRTGRTPLDVAVE